MMLKEVVFITIFLSVLGFINAFFLHWQYVRFKRTKRPVFCLMGEDCGKVIGSVYGATLGIKNEVMGMVYYALVAALALALLIFQGIPFLVFVILPVAFTAAIFSLYLFYVQTVLLKNLCSWCLIAIGINILIFILFLKLVG